MNLPTPRDRRWRVRAAVAALLVLGGLLLPPGGQREAAAFIVPGSSAFLQTLDRGNTFRLVVSGLAGDRVVASQVYGRPALSPDGTRVAYTAPLSDGSDGRYGLFVVDVDGANKRRLTAPAIGDFDPAWSPDGLTIAVSRDERGNFEDSCCTIWVMSADGTGQRRLANATSARQPSFAPYGTNIVYTSPDGIRMAGVSGSGNRLLGTGALSWPTFSPDGSTVAAVLQTGLQSGSVVLMSTSGDRRLRNTSAGTGGGLPEAPVYTSATTLMHLNVWGNGENGRVRTEVRRTTIGGGSGAIYRGGTPMFYLAWTDGLPCPQVSSTPPPSPAGDAPVIHRLGTWFLRSEPSSGPGQACFTYGRPRGDHPLTGDWDGDGTRTPAVFRGNAWHLRNSNSQGPADVSFTFGAAGDVPVVGDWDGDGTDTIGVFRGNAWHLRNANSSGPADLSFAYGARGDRPVTGDWDGDGTTTIGVYRAGAWHLSNSVTSPTAVISVPFGRSTDLPVVADWNGDGTDTIGIFRSGTWFLSNRNDRVDDFEQFSYGRVRDNPLAWR